MAAANRTECQGSLPARWGRCQLARWFRYFGPSEGLPYVLEKLDVVASEAGEKLFREASRLAAKQPAPTELATTEGLVIPPLLHPPKTHYKIPSSASFSTGRASTALLPRTTRGLWM